MRNSQASGSRRRYGVRNIRAMMVVLGVIAAIGMVAACAPIPSDPGAPPTTLEPLPDPPGHFSVLAYNVAGLPEGISESHPERNMNLISPLLNAYDVVLTQEDFDWWTPLAGILDFRNYHQRLRSQAVHPWRTDRHPGPEAVGVDAGARGLLVGDGIGIMAKYPFGEQTVVPWKGCFGGALPFDHGAADCLAMKGFRMVTMTLGDGFEVDVYSLHAEAGSSATDQRLQEKDFEQLAQFINARGAHRAVIMGGDTNLHTDEVTPEGGGGADTAIWEKFLAETGLTDACIRLSCADTGSIDKIAYRNGSLVLLDATSHDFPTERFSYKGKDLSDHPPLVVEFDWDSAALGN